MINKISFYLLFYSMENTCDTLIKQFQDIYNQLSRFSLKYNITIDKNKKKTVDVMKNIKNEFHKNIWNDYHDFYKNSTNKILNRLLDDLIKLNYSIIQISSAHIKKFTKIKLIKPSLELNIDLSKQKIDLTNLQTVNNILTKNITILKNNISTLISSPEDAVNKQEITTLSSQYTDLYIEELNKIINLHSTQLNNLLMLIEYVFGNF